MSRVWLAHDESGCPVAIKILSASPDPNAWLRGHEEVRALARLQHPYIASLLDYGELDAAAADVVGEPLGSSYLVTALAERGSLSEARGRLDWESLSQALWMLLDALAHAHARGFVHRDIKPSNVHRSADGGIRLIDFGLAHRRELAARGELAGTPPYMAPEQFDVTQAHVGAPTDLYALGCLGYALATGDPPFGRSGDVAAMQFAHMNSTVPLLFPRTSLPSEFEKWLARLLRKRPEERFATAADAARALSRFSGAPRPVLHALRGLSDDGELTSKEELIVAAPIVAVSDDAPRPRVAKRIQHLRTPRVDGRAKEQVKLWTAFGAVTKQQQPALVVIEGPSGSGKSVLATWLCERVGELGVAVALAAVHAPTGGQRHGLVDMLRRHLGCGGLAGDHLRQRVEAALGRFGVSDAEESAALAELLAPRAVAGIRFASQHERHLAVARFLRTLASKQQVVLCMDDVQWSPSSIVFVRELLEGSGDSPLLVVMTCRDEPIKEDGPARRLLRALLADRSGHPDDVHLVLTERADGLAFIDSLRARVGALHAAFTVEQSKALQVAACLGREVDTHEWHAMCARLEVEPCAVMLDALFDAGVALPDVQGHHIGWSFTHEAVRELVERRRGRRPAELHRLCAAVLSEQGAPQERIARHRIASGEARTIVDPLLQGAVRTRVATGDFVLADVLLTEREQSLGAANCPPEDSRWGRGWLLRAQLQVRRGELRLAHSWAQRAQQAAAKYRWQRVAVDACIQLSAISLEQGDFAAARAWLDQARTGARTPAQEALLEMEHAALCYRSRELPQAAERGQRARLLFASMSDTDGASRAEVLLGAVAAARGAWDEARKQIRSARAAFRSLGDRYNYGRCHVALGDVSRQCGRHGEAVRYYARAERRFYSVGATHALATTSGKRLLNDVLWELASPEQAALERDAPTLEAAAVHVGELERRQCLGAAIAVRLTLLAAYARAAMWSHFDEALEAAIPLAERVGFHPDVVAAGQATIAWLEQHGDERRARACRRLM